MDTKKCIKCRVYKKSSSFYKQANSQPENTCKECKKAYRRRKYQSEKKGEGLSRLVQFIDVILEAEIEELKKLNNEAREILIRHNHRIALSA